MYDLITLDLYICLVRPSPQAYQLKPFSPSHIPYSFILINSLVWKVHIVWNFNFLSEGKCDCIVEVITSIWAQNNLFPIGLDWQWINMIFGKWEKLPRNILHIANWSELNHIKSGWHLSFWLTDLVSAQSKAPSGPGWQLRSRRGPGGGGRRTAPCTRPPGRPLEATQLFLSHLPPKGARSFLNQDDQWHPFGHPGKHDPWKLNYHANYSTCCRRSSRKTSSDPCLNGVTDGELMEGLGRVQS